MTRWLLGLVGALALAGASVAGAEDSATGAAEAEVRNAVIAFNQSYLDNDIEKYFGFYLDDATMWLNADFSTVADYRKTWTDFIGAGAAVVGNEVTELQVRVGPSGDAAVASYRLKVSTRQPDGSVAVDNAQETDAWTLTENGWRIVHLHYAFQPAE